MDSLTQITLGAAVGEAVLGRKLGNRAMLWGAIGGTIPDLDVFSGAWLTEIESLAVHRGITHSIIFAIAMAALFGWLAWKLYNTELYRYKGWKNFVFAVNALIGVTIGIGLFTLFSDAGLAIRIISGGVISGLLLLFLWWLLQYRKGDVMMESTAFGEWYVLFFLAFTTHIALDCFTTYGTQVFQPFSNYRVAFNTIAVVDPLYTVPFIICLIVALSLGRTTRGRRLANWLGIGLSSAYLLFTIVNKQHINSVFERSLTQQQIEVNRYMTSPTILNNILWNCVAEGDTSFYMGLYSLYDAGDTIHYINHIPKSDTLLEEYADDRTIKTLKWFSNDYLNVERLSDSTYMLSELRFGARQDTISSYEDYIFNFKLLKKGDAFELVPYREMPSNLSEEFRKFVGRIRGR